MFTPSVKTLQTYRDREKERVSDSDMQIQNPIRTILSQFKGCDYIMALPLHCWCGMRKIRHRTMDSSKIGLSQFLWSMTCLLGLTTACGVRSPVTELITRRESIPVAAVKMIPEKDSWPPIAAPGWTKPVPLEGLINTAGAEDSPFITSDGNTLYFFFTPDVNVPAEGQVGDGFTGIWQTTRNREQWLEPQRILLADPDESHLDGCPFVMDSWMAFCSARASNQREIDIYTADLQDGNWTSIQNWGEPFNLQYRVGELHIATDGDLYFGSDRSGGLGGFDLWVSHWNGKTWETPVNLGAAINTANDENRPFITSDGQELWFDGVSKKGYPGPAIFRSLLQPDGSWGPAEEIIYSFAGEPTLTGDGNTLYFVHHYFSADLSQMIEADIYISTRLSTND
jgi:hypothetical protein